VVKNGCARNVKSSLSVWLHGNVMLEATQPCFATPTDEPHKNHTRTLRKKFENIAKCILVEKELCAII